MQHQILKFSSKQLPDQWNRGTWKAEVIREVLIPLWTNIFGNFDLQQSGSWILFLSLVLALSVPTATSIHSHLASSFFVLFSIHKARECKETESIAPTNFEHFKTWNLYGLSHASPSKMELKLAFFLLFTKQYLSHVELPLYMWHNRFFLAYLTFRIETRMICATLFQRVVKSCIKNQLSNPDCNTNAIEHKMEFAKEKKNALCFECQNVKIYLKVIWCYRQSCCENCYHLEVITERLPRY